MIRSDQLTAALLLAVLSLSNVACACGSMVDSADTASRATHHEAGAHQHGDSTSPSPIDCAHANCDCDALAASGFPDRGSLTSSGPLEPDDEIHRELTKPYPDRLPSSNRSTGPPPDGVLIAPDTPVLRFDRLLD